jgi:hypothetical protein
MTPRRLFHIPSMSTIMYKDVGDDVKEKGYAAVSHVWGVQQLYFADELGIKGGVNWKIPLSHTNKISRLVNAARACEIEYCWWDILCMPQDKQDEIDQEISLMGNYYSGAKMTFVLATAEYTISDDYDAWFNIISGAIDDERALTIEEIQSIRLYSMPILDISKEEWFERVWTFQETVLSGTLCLIGMDESMLCLSDAIAAMGYSAHDNNIGGEWFANSVGDISTLYVCMLSCKNGSSNLADAVSYISHRKCLKPQDRFYAILGILGYDDFTVDYNIDMESLNAEMAKYAYSRGDISWMAITNGVGTRFIQPMYMDFSVIGDGWTEDEPNICNIRFEDDVVYVNTSIIGKVGRCKNIYKPEFSIQEFITEIGCELVEWGFDDSSITRTFMGFCSVEIFMATMIIGLVGKNLDDLAAAKELSDIYPIEYLIEHALEIRYRLNALYQQSGDIVSIVEVSNIPLIVSGFVDTGDNLMLLGMHDIHDRSLGIIASDAGERKGICVCPNLGVESYTPYKLSF